MEVVPSWIFPDTPCKAISRTPTMTGYPMIYSAEGTPKVPKTYQLTPTANNTNSYWEGEKKVRFL